MTKFTIENLDTDATAQLLCEEIFSHGGGGTEEFNEVVYPAITQLAQRCGGWQQPSNQRAVTRRQHDQSEKTADIRQSEAPHRSGIYA